MMQQRRGTVEALFQEAADLSPDERRAFLAGLEAKDAALHAEVASLLGFLEEPRVASLAAVDAADAAEFVGDLIGPYRILDLIGEGGFGAVYLAEQEEPIRRQVALKIIKLGMDTKQVIARFEAERQVLALMGHPNIARVLDAGATEQGRPYFVMELVRGMPITDYCDAHDLPVPERLALFASVCHAVQHAHQKGVIHRDIKPSNVLVAQADGAPTPKVIDFGIAKATGQRLAEATLLTEFHQFVGTPEYMSPEQTESDVGLDTRTDIYSLGAVLYVLLTGRTPFDRMAMQKAGLAEIQRIVREETPPTPSQQLRRLGSELESVARSRGVAPPTLSRVVRGDLDWIVMRALEKDRARRYESAAAFAADVQRVLNREPVEAGPPSTWYRMAKFARRNRISVGVTLVVVIALITGLTLALVGLDEARRAHHGLARERDIARDARDSAERERRRAERSATAAEAARGREAEARARAERSREAAVKEATRARKVSQFLQGILTTALPVATGAKQEVTVRSLLLVAIHRLDAGALDEQPLEEVMVRGTIACGFATLGEYSFAEQQVRRSLAVAVEHVGPQSLEALGCRNLLGTILVRQGHFKAAEREAREAILLGIEHFGADHPELLRTQAILAAALTAQNRLREAEKLLRRVLRHQIARSGLDDKVTLFSLNGLAVNLGRQGRLAESERIHRKVLAARRRIDGPNALETTTSMLNLCPVLVRLGRVDEALDLAGEALAINRRSLGAKHPNTALAIHNMAVSFQAKGEIQRAIELFREALAIQQEVLGAGHDATRRTLRNVALVCLSSQRVGEAEALMEEWDEAFRAAVEQGDADAEAYRSYAVLLLTTSHRDLRDAEAGLAMAERARAKAGDTPTILVTLGFGLYANGRIEEACGAIERALAHPGCRHLVDSQVAAMKSQWLRWAAEFRGTAGVLIASARLAALALRRTG